MFPVGAPRYFTPDLPAIREARGTVWHSAVLCGVVWCGVYAAGRTRAILFCNIMLDSSSSARLDILDVIGSNLLYHPVSTIGARTLRPAVSTVQRNATDIFPDMHFRTIRRENIVGRESASANA